MDTDIDYQFASKFIDLLEKIAKRNWFPLNLIEASSNPQITMAYVSKHLNKPWFWKGLTCNPSISVAYMDEHPDYPWNQLIYYFRKLDRFDWPPVIGSYSGSDGDTGRPFSWSCYNVSLAYIETQMSWIDTQIAIWAEISDNPNLTLDFIDKYSDKPWNYEILARNSLTSGKEKFRREYLAAYTIQQAYARAKYIPSYAYCRKLHRQFYESIIQ